MATSVMSVEQRRLLTLRALELAYTFRPDGTLPTQAEIAAEMGLHVDTVRGFLASPDASELSKEISPIEKNIAVVRKAATDLIWPSLQVAADIVNGEIKASARDKLSAARLILALAGVTPESIATNVQTGMRQKTTSSPVLVNVQVGALPASVDVVEAEVVEK